MISENIAFLFPGQGSQTIGMGEELAKSFPIAKQLYNQADHLLDFPLSKLSWNGPLEKLNDTVNTQPALMVHSIAALQVLKELNPNLIPAYVAGHSMGELSALVAAHSLSFSEGLQLVRKRGELMKQAGESSPGRMAAVIGLDISTLEEICHDASTQDDIVQVANDNCPGQVVISGSSEALKRVMQASKDKGAKLVKPLAVSIAAHSPLMYSAQEEFNQAVQTAPIKNPHIPIIGNVSALPLNDSAEIRADLQAQLTSRVRWTESIQYLITQGVTNFIEIGNGNVLTGLVKRIDRHVNRFVLGAPDDFYQLNQS